MIRAPGAAYLIRGRGGLCGGWCQDACRSRRFRRYHRRSRRRHSYPRSHRVVAARRCTTHPVVGVFVVSLNACFRRFLCTFDRQRMLAMSFCFLVHQTLETY